MDDCKNIIPLNYGRLSQIFNKNIYLGIDLNKNALEKAKIDNEGYKYEETFIDPIEYSHADLLFFYIWMI